jgi:hypothetical protein
MKISKKVYHIPNNIWVIYNFFKNLHIVFENFNKLLMLILTLKF